MDHYDNHKSIYSYAPIMDTSTYPFFLPRISCNISLVQYLNWFQADVHKLLHTTVLATNSHYCHLKPISRTLCWSNLCSVVCALFYYIRIFKYCNKNLPHSIILVHYIRWFHYQFKKLIKVYLI